MQAGIILNRTNSDDADFRAFVELLDKDLRIRDGDDHAFYAQFNKIDMIRNVVTLFLENKAIGCGAFKQYDAETVEIKRMFVLPECRGIGYATEVLKKLEKWAAELGYKQCLLETGKKQPEAIALYNKNGYFTIPDFGQYANVEASVCMKKVISS